MKAWMQIGIALAASSAFCQNYAAWTKSGTITLGTTPEWADFTGTAANFPVLIRLDSSVFNFGEAKPAGADIRFSNSAGTQALAYEIETWDVPKGKAAVWVRVPSITGNALQLIKMYWGNAAAAAESNGAAVFAPADGYAGVWHLSDDAASALNKDATGSGKDGTRMRVENEKELKPDPAAVVLAESPLGTGQAYNLDGKVGSTNVPAGKLDLKNKNITVSAWIKRAVVDHPGDFFVSQGTQDPNKGMRMGFDAQNKFLFGFDGGGDDSEGDAHGPATETQDWHHWVGTFNLADKKMTLYQDGAMITSSTSDSSFGGSGSLDLGWSFGPSGEYYHPGGWLDEVRISTNVATPDAIKLAYLNQKASQTLAGYPVPSGCVENLAIAPPPASVAEGAALVLVGTAKCAQRFQWVRVEGAAEVPLSSDGVRLKVVTRIKGTGAVKYRLKGLFDGVWKSKDVDVNITEGIPEPEFSLVMPSYFNFLNQAEGMKAYPLITNKAAILASPAPVIKFTWTRAGVKHFVFKDADTLAVFFEGEEGTLTVKLCLENGGPEICQEKSVTASTAVRPAARRQAPFALNGLALKWNQDAGLGIWDLDGRLVFERSGRKGQTLSLTPRQAGMFHSKRYAVKVTRNRGSAR